MKLDDELKDISPWLRDIRKGDAGFGVPPGYFDQMEESVFQQLDALGARRQNAVATRREGFWTALLRPRLALGFGALVVLALAIWSWQQPWTKAPAAQPLAATDLTAEDAEAYLLENALEIDADLLAAHLPEEEAAPEYLPPPSGQNNAAGPNDLEISNEEINDLLDEMSEEELEDLL